MKPYNSRDLNKICKSLRDKYPNLNCGENNVKGPHAEGCKSKIAWEASGRKTGVKWAKMGLGRLAQASRPSPFRAWIAAPFYLVVPRALRSSDAKSQKEIHSSSATTRPRMRRLDQQGSPCWPSSTSEVSTPCTTLQCVTLWGKILICPWDWRGILRCNHQTYVLDLFAIILMLMVRHS
jgi:hypothetical protein